MSQRYSTSFVCVPPDVISLQLCTPKVIGVKQVIRSLQSTSISKIMERELQRNCLLSGSPVANPKSRPDHSVFIKKYIFFNFTYPLRRFRVPPKMSSRTPGGGVKFPINFFNQSLLWIQCWCWTVWKPIFIHKFLGSHQPQDPTS
jgi:hypothetical protein